MRVNGIIYGTDDVISSNKKGTTYSQLMHIVDFFPSLLSAAGIDYRDYVNNLDNFDGIDHWNGLSFDEPNDPYFEYRSNLYYGGLDPLIEAGYRDKWMKLFNVSGGFPDGYCCSQGQSMNISMLEKEYQDKIRNLSMIYAPEEAELYNIQNDPNETDNIRILHPLSVIELWNAIVGIESTAVPPVPSANCPSAPHPIDPVINIGIWIPWC